MEWIMSANPLIYDHRAAFKTNGFIDWKQTRNFSVNDIIYIYCSRNISRIQYKVYVEKINMNKDEIVQDDLFWKKKTKNTGNRFMRLKLIQYIDLEELSLDVLRQHGMKYVPQSPAYLKPEIGAYLKKYFERCEYE